MRIFLIIIQLTFAYNFYAQINIDSTARAKKNYADFKYRPDFFVNGEERQAIIVNYPNGQVTKSVYSTTGESCCDSLVKYHPNGVISFIGKLFYWESVYDSLWENDVEAIYYESEMYYEDSKLAAKKYVTDSLIDYVVYDTNESPYYQLVFVNGNIQHGLRSISIDDYWEEFELIYNYLPVLYINVNKINKKIESYKWLDDSEVNKSVIIDVIEFDGWYLPNNIELFDLNGDFYFKW